MSDDVLFDAARALRDAAGEEPARPDETRARVLSSLRRQRARRLTIIKAVIPLAALLVGSLAWAGPGRLPALVRAVISTILGDAEGEPKAPSGAAPRSPLAPAPSGADAIEPAIAPEAKAAPVAARAEDDEPRAVVPPEPRAVVPPEPRAVVPPEPRAALPRTMELNPSPAAPSRASPPGAPATNPRAAPPEASARPEPDGRALALYKEAHRLHFVERSPGAALRAWDDYLRHDPGGRFSVEAHYNRALCLVRLGRTSEARRALDAFARGAFGGYRRDEARALLTALGEGAP